MTRPPPHSHHTVPEVAVSLSATASPLVAACSRSRCSPSRRSRKPEIVDVSDNDASGELLLDQLEQAGQEALPRAQVEGENVRKCSEQIAVRTCRVSAPTDITSMRNLVEQAGRLQFLVPAW